MDHIKKITITLITVFVLGACLIVSNFGSALFQEGNPIPLIVSALKLEFSDTEYVQFAKTEKRNRYLSINSDNNRYEVVKEFMNSKGWKYQEQMGSGLIFSKNGEDAVVEVRQFSSNYFIWEIQKAFFN
ncbi:hypothetical protein [Neobacillus sp.]|uniref:hypothetical protein n=1 Tax=Neobacillus sp. TaxID=2675273 RepID=UPI002899E410|nr:hypothetical protein [Neobacillus sp.]